MRANKIGLFFFVACLIVYLCVFPRFEQHRAPVKLVQTRGMILPPFVVKLISLEFRTLIANFLFARSSQYLGGKIQMGQTASPDDLYWIYRNMIVITELDPYLEDPYYFGNALLTWGAGRYNEANYLLEKGASARTWDWQLPFFIGFNKFYFLKDSKGAAEYILEAAKRPAAPPFLPPLAARLYSSTGRTENAVDFLIIFWRNEKDERIKKQYAIRIEALKQIQVLEEAVIRYRTRTGRLPKNLRDLVKVGIIKQIPSDPYGGTFYLSENGSVMTTSNLAFKPKLSTETAN